MSRPIAPLSPFSPSRAFGRAEPLLELPGHSHWVWKAQYNPFHPSLLASASSDASVCLWFTPILAAAKDAAQARAAISKAAAASPAVAAAADVDGRVHEYDEHDDSVYALAWSSVDPWLLASLSYDGRLVVSRVPKGVKYKVLL